MRVRTCTIGELLKRVFIGDIIVYFRKKEKADLGVSLTALFDEKDYVIAWIRYSNLDINQTPPHPPRKTITGANIVNKVMAKPIVSTGLDLTAMANER